MNYRLHHSISTTRPSPEGALAFELGVRVGYWPCLKGPFVSMACGFRRLDLWFGLPSYWSDRAPVDHQRPSRFMAPPPVIVPQDATRLERIRLRYGRFGPPRGSVDAAYLASFDYGNDSL